LFMVPGRRSICRSGPGVVRCPDLATAPWSLPAETPPPPLAAAAFVLAPAIPSCAIVCGEAISFPSPTPTGVFGSTTVLSCFGATERSLTALDCAPLSASTPTPAAAAACCFLANAARWRRRSCSASAAAACAWPCAAAAVHHFMAVGGDRLQPCPCW